MFKIFHYDIHEYQLFQQELNELANNGYTTDKISYITHFKKSEKPIYYLVDIWTSDEKSIFKRREDKQRYIDYYLENDYELISSFKNLLVFKGEKEIKARPVQHKIAQKEINKRLIHFSLSVLLFFFILIFFILSLKPYHLTTNGKIFFYLSLVLISISIIYKTLLRWIGTYKFSKKVSLYKHLKEKYKISTFAPIIFILLMAISLVIDVIDTKTPASIPDEIPTLEYFNINKETEYSILERSSFIVPESFEYIEYTKDEEKSLYVKTYTLTSEEKAQSFLEELLSKPEDLYVDKIKKINDNEYLGYCDNKAYIKITRNNKTISLINTSFEIK